MQTLVPSSLPYLRSIASGGEACTTALVERWANQVNFFNAYGPTEATVCTNIAKMEVDAKANWIGQPLGDSVLQILSETLQWLPIGAIGELYISGNNVTQGYLDRPELNMNHFITLSGVRWYKSGDKMRLMPNNQFEYLGRKDRQIKLRGLRIELGEVEAVLQRYKNIQQSICQMIDYQIIAYIVCQNEINTSEVIEFAANQLPRFMLPNQIIQIDSLPLLPSGKINLKALPIPAHAKNVFILPRNETENILYTIWKNHLPIKSFSIDQDFFSLGGNSLQAMQIIADIDLCMHATISIDTFYTHTTIESQAVFIQSLDLSTSHHIQELIDQLSFDEQMDLLALSNE